MPKKFFGRDVSDTAFSIDRLFVWAVGIYGLIGVLAMAWQDIGDKTIAPQVQSLTMICVGVIAGRIERKIVGK